jgi:hypothetical protein
MGFPTSANIESNVSVSNLMYSAKNGAPKSSYIACYQYTKVHWCHYKDTPNHVRKLQVFLSIKHLQFPDMLASGGHADTSRVVDHSSDKLLIQQNSISDGQAIHPVQDSSPTLLVCATFYSPDQYESTRSAFIKGHP